MDISPTNLQKLILNVQDELLCFYGVRAHIGCEVEFYLTDAQNHIISEGIVHKFKELMFNRGIAIEQEKGKGQYEVQTSHDVNVMSVISEVYYLKELLENMAKELGLVINFQPKPFTDDYGSALHVHLNLEDRNKDNIFALRAIEENEPLKQVIYGILDLLAEGVYFFSKEEDFARFTPKFMAPTNISWGGNNRTTAIRIPDSKPEFRRIEFRVPSANAHLEKVIIFMLIGTLHGLSKKDLYYQRIYGNAFDQQYSLQLLPKALKESEKIFHTQKVLKNYIGRFETLKRGEGSI